MAARMIETPSKTCLVCGEKDAPTGMHYGAVTCYACRAFFRRSPDRKRTTRCKFQSDCSVSKNDKQCVECRLQKCLSVGMKLALVLNENERKQRFKVSIEKKKLEGNVAPVSEDSTVPGPVLEWSTREPEINWNNESPNIIPLPHSSIPVPVVITQSNNLLQDSMPSTSTLSRDFVKFEPEKIRSGETFPSQHLSPPTSLYIHLPIPPTSRYLQYKLPTII